MKKSLDTPSFVVGLVLALVVEFMCLCNTPNITHLFFGEPALVMCDSPAAHDLPESYP